jgi:hypothetical protein
VARFWSVAAVIASVASVLAAQAALAAPSNTKILTFPFTGCTGPAGTPASFSALKEPSSGASLRLLGSSVVYVTTQAVDVDSGAVLFSTPGFQNNSVQTVVCYLTHPVTKAHLRVTGLLTPVN